MADGYAISLYDANGMYVEEWFTDEDMAQAANRDLVIDSGGKIYVWNQRNSQWRAAAGVARNVPVRPEPETKAPSKS